MRTFPFASLALAFALAPAAQAHEVWIERDASGPARIYLGEPAEAVPPGGDPEFAKLKTPKLLAVSAPLTRNADHLAVAAPADADLRLTDDTVFAPWKTASGALEGAVFHAREGLRDPSAKLDFEIVPAGAGRFTVIYAGKPLGDASVVAVNPDKWSKSFKTDANGQLVLPASAKGRYIIAARHAVDGPRTIQGQAVAKVHHVSTLTFVNP